MWNSQLNQIQGLDLGLSRFCSVLAVGSGFLSLDMEFTKVILKNVKDFWQLTVRSPVFSQIVDFLVPFV
jgi:hypothetical protein